MISGRGLGITGGTLDKLESIPGFNVNLDEKRALKQLEKIGVFMIGQTEDICPADKKLYALRDVTGTVPSQPLIVASIMSKKLAENLDRLVLDVKFGSGAFMKTKEDAQKLADAMKSVGESMKVKTSYVLNSMDEPLGHSVGNALEIAECVEILQGGGPKGLIKLILDLAEKVSETPRAHLEKRLQDGSAWNKFTSLVYAQDGDATMIDKLLDQHRAPIIEPWKAKSSGTIKKVDAELIGRASVLLGAGRQRTTDPIDFAVGFSKIKKVSEKVDLDKPVFMIHARNERSIVNINSSTRKSRRDWLNRFAVPKISAAIMLRARLAQGRRPKSRARTESSYRRLQILRTARSDSESNKTATPSHRRIDAIMIIVLAATLVRSYEWSRSRRRGFCSDRGSRRAW